MMADLHVCGEKCDLILFMYSTQATYASVIITLNYFCTQ